MMWIGLAILLTFVGGLNGEGCREMFMDECGTNDIPDSPPETKEDVDHLCEIGDVKTECALRIFTKCEDETEHERAVSKEVEMYVHGLRKMVGTVCDKDSKVYEAITSNIGCIMNTFRTTNGLCSALREKRYNLATTYFEVLNKGSTEADSKEKCFDAVLENACLAVLISEKCGKELLDPVLEGSLSFSSVYLEKECSPEIIQEIPMFTHALAAIEEEVSDVVNEMKKRKK